MSQIVLTDAERREALVRLGYTPREAAFLSLAALHSGFFLRRQYCTSIAKEAGGTAAALVEKLSRKGHGKAFTGCRNARVYHLSSRPFYAALGQQDNRNRREREPMAIKNKLMTLDFVLDHPGHRYLATEQEKVAYFTCELGIDLANLPCKRFQPPNTQESTSRFFVDKYPIFVSEQVPGAATATFCFIDEGAVTSGRFESYLMLYRRLFAQLACFEVIYTAAAPTLFSLAERSFNAFTRSARNPSGPAQDGMTEHVLRHFADRNLYETGRYESFDRAKLISYRNDLQEFSKPSFEALYARWMSVGESAVREAFASQTSGPTESQSRFSTCLLRHNYDVFGS